MAGHSEPTLRDVMNQLKALEEKIDQGAKRTRHDITASPKISPQMKPLPPPAMPLCGWASPDIIDRVLYSKESIHTRVKELANEVSEAYSGSTEDSLVIVGLLSGVYMFMADFTRELNTPHQVDFVAASSYGLGTISSADVKIKKDLDNPVAGKDVVILDEMCDTGGTMASLKQLMLDRGANTVKCCVMLDKYERRTAAVTLDFVGFRCPDEFLVGYGMDWANRFRSLRDICVVKRSAYQK